MSDPNGKYANWIQFALLLVSLLALAIHGEGRLARVEQQLADDADARRELAQRMANVEAKLDRWQSTHSRFQIEQ